MPTIRWTGTHGGTKRLQKRSEKTSRSFCRLDTAHAIGAMYTNGTKMGGVLSYEEGGHIFYTLTPYRKFTVTVITSPSLFQTISSIIDLYNLFSSSGSKSSLLKLSQKSIIAESRSSSVILSACLS